MAYLEVKELQAWLETTKMEVAVVDPQLELTAKNLVFGTLTRRYVVTGWTDGTNTPTMVTQIMSMYIAAWMYRKQYSEDITNDSRTYADDLEAQASALLCQLESAEVSLLDAVATTTSSSIGRPAFFPTNASSSAGAMGEPMFSIQKVF